MCVHPFSLMMVLNLLIFTGERLTSWMCVYPFLSVVLIHSNTGEQLELTYWMHVVHSHQFWSTQTLESDSHAGCMFTHSRQWFWSPQTLSNLNSLSGCVTYQFLSVVFISLKTEDWLTPWMHVHPFLLVVLIPSNTRELEWLTAWLCVYPFLSVVLIFSSTGEWLTPWMEVFTHSCQWFRVWFSHTSRSNLQTGCASVFHHSCQWF